MLDAIFPELIIAGLRSEIMKVLEQSGAPQTDCRQTDDMVEAACDLVPQLIRRYA